MTTKFDIGNKVAEKDYSRTGEIIEILERPGKETRYRIRWQDLGKNLRTWMRESNIIFAKNGRVNPGDRCVNCGREYGDHRLQDDRCPKVYNGNFFGWEETIFMS